MAFALRLLALSGVIALSVSCAQVPRYEFNAFLEASEQLHSVTEDTLDIVAAYEREVIRNVAETTGAPPDAPDPRAAAATADDLSEFGLAPKQIGLQLEPSAAVSSGAGAIPAACRGRTGPGQFCYQYRAAYATIGDPLLVAAVRRLSDVLYRYNAVLAAYGNGASGEILAADLARLQGELGAGLALLGTAAPAVPAGVAGAFKALDPIARAVGKFRDRKALVDFLLGYADQVDAAYEAMAQGSTELFSNVYEGTTILSNRRGTTRVDEAALRARRDQIRELIANWTVLIDRSRRLLRELRIALANPGTLEPRLREMGLISARSLAAAEIVRAQIMALGLPPN